MKTVVIAAVAATILPAKAQLFLRGLYSRAVPGRIGGDNVYTLFVS